MTSSTPRSTRPRQTDKPKITLNVDKLTREGAPDEPFVAAVGGKPYTFADPMETEWQDLVVISPQDTIPFLKALLGDQFDEFLKHRMEFWRLGRLVTAVQTYYGMIPEGSASPTS